MTIKEKQNKSFDALKEKFGYKNKMQTPRLSKVIITCGTGSQKDKKKKDLIGERLNKIAGQKVSEKGAKKSIATFKVRQGDPVGYMATLRGERMMNFLEKLVNIALPRTKDFRGLKGGAISNGDMNIGIKEHTIFPETADEDIKDVFSLGVTIVTTSKTKEETRAFLEILGFPFAKEVVKK